MASRSFPAGKRGGASPARDQARHNNLNNPARKYFAIALLDGDKRSDDGYNPGSTSWLNLGDDQPYVTFIPGTDHPEAVILDTLSADIAEKGKVLPRLTLALQMGHRASDRGSTWANFHDDDVRAMWDPVRPLLPLLSDATH
ncbi:hypothetical protein [Microbacterium sp. SORGH_AS_0888]|uniref:hypothetical protein n=1 Tax=Microbacterium sp. SORGH_AS_0888 TaxID=3041791 RepID=UPI00278214CF|nr:hypothetical protein [Microbacterium sp. SORGH_AS_0888]MDQ1130249.1 hypothetical protein [Microbacterium sp. SORGH_AS_0888]